MKRILVILLSMLLTVSLLTACGNQEETEQGLKDGYYTAKMSEFSHGWKEYITILVKGGSIVCVEYNAENASGFIKSWDNAYMQNMLHSNGTYPNEYTRYYAGQLLEGQGEGSIDAISGATSSHGTFLLLSQAVLEQSRKGDSSIMIVDAAH
ncbi:MAG: FMN-binding protein [Lachnospiraceae bacterium]|nr:FMN-binding protein [Lachnospiraceae bacterium]